VSEPVLDVVRVHQLSSGSTGVGFSQSPWMQLADPAPSGQPSGQSSAQIGGVFFEAAMSGSPVS
jgi:hypothetical protein